MVQVTSTPVLTTARKVGGSVSYYIDGKLIVGVGATIPLASLDDWARGSIIRGGPTEWDAYDAKTAGAVLIGDGTDIISDTSPTLVGLLTLNAGLALGGASGVNVVTVPDNVAPAFNLVDAGGLEYLRIVSTDAQPVIDFNNAAADVDFHVGANGVADAFQVQGNDGEITMGALGPGFVQSDAGGVLSSAAIIAGDLPAHTHAGAATGGSLVIGTTDTDATPGSVLFAGAAGVIQEANAGLFYASATTRLGVGIATPDGTLHVHTATAGAVTPSANADDLIAENSASGGISILTPDASLGSLYFGSPSDAIGAGIRWQYSTKILQVGSFQTGGVVHIRSDTGATGIILDASQNTEFAGNITLPEYIYHLGDTDTYIRYRTDRATLVTGGVTMWDAVEAGGTDYVNFDAGLVFLNRTSNSKMTQGITIDNGGSDNEAFALANSDVTHGATTIAETDVFCDFLKVTNASGGWRARGFSESTIGVRFQALKTTDSTTKSAAGEGAVEVNAYKISGTGVTNVNASENVFAVRAQLAGSLRTLAIVAADGDLYLDTVVNENAWDDYDDAGLLHGLRASLAPDGSELKRRFGQWIDYARPVLESTGVIAYNDDGHHFVATKKLQMLTIDAVRQLYEKCARYEHALTKAGLLEVA